MNKLALISIGIATFLSRVIGQWSEVFVNGNVIFRGQDSWYHLRLVQVLIHNFPAYLHNDYFVNPLGQPQVGYPPLLTYLIAIPGLILSEHAMEVYAALLPPVFAALTVIIVYFLSKEILHNKTFALIAAFLVGILPSQFFQKTLLGFTDHHFLEVFLVSLSLLLLLKLPKSPWNIAFLGLTLGALVWTWTGAGYIILALTLAVIARLYQLRLKKKSITNLSLGFSVAILIALLMFLPTSKYNVAATENALCLAVGVIVPLAFLGLTIGIRDMRVFTTATAVSGIALLVIALRLLP
ncbi:hypothetical protein LCGC14_2303250, partial [marine sediment metagenome]